MGLWTAQGGAAGPGRNRCMFIWLLYIMSQGEPRVHGLRDGGVEITAASEQEIDT